MKAATTWTAPYYGLTHLESADRRFRASVNTTDGWSELSMWTPGCGFSPQTRLFRGEGHEAAAKADGEAWLKATAR